MFFTRFWLFKKMLATDLHKNVRVYYARVKTTKTRYSFIVNAVPSSVLFPTRICRDRDF